MSQEPVRVVARDGVALAADLFLPGRERRGAVLVAPAMGVARFHYAAFAAHLAGRGLAALVLDYRGIGGSRAGPLRGSRATLHDWAEQDLAGALDLLAARFPDAPILWVGHSAGGQLLGLVPEPPVAAALLVGASTGYWRAWPARSRLAIATLWYAAIPALVPVFGRLPAAVLGGGEDLPPGVAREWAAWGRDPEYALSYARPRGGRAFARWRGPLRSYAFADDFYAPVAGVRTLTAFYAAARAEVRVVSPRELGVGRIGHFGFFRPRFAATLWAEAGDWLVAAAASAGSPAGASIPP